MLHDEEVLEVEPKKSRMIFLESGEGVKTRVGRVSGNNYFRPSFGYRNPPLL